MEIKAYLSPELELGLSLVTKTNYINTEKRNLHDSLVVTTSLFNLVDNWPRCIFGN